MDDKVSPAEALKKKVNALAENTVSGKVRKGTIAYFLLTKCKIRTNKAVSFVEDFEKGDNGGATKGTSVSEVAKEEKPLNGGSSSVVADNIDFGSDESGSKNDVLLVENVEKPKALPRKRKRGADREIANQILPSLEKSLPMLRPRKEVAFFRKVKLSESDFGRIIGKRVKIYWPDSRRWFVGCIKSFDAEKKLHKILYNDGDAEDLDLTRERFELEVVASEAFAPCSGLGINLVKKNMGSTGIEVSEKSNEGDSFSVSVTEPVKKYSRKKKDVVSEVAEKGRLNQHGGHYTEEKEEHWPRDMEVDVVLENIDKKLVGDEIDHVENHDVVNCGNDSGITESLSKVAVETDEKLAEVAVEAGEKLVEAQAIGQEHSHENEATNSLRMKQFYVSVGNTIKQRNVMSDASQVAAPSTFTKDENHETLIRKKLKGQTIEGAGRIVRDKESIEMNFLDAVLGTTAESGVSDSKTIDSQPLSDTKAKKNEVDTNSVTLKNYFRYGHEKVKVAAYTCRESAVELELQQSCLHVSSSRVYMLLWHDVKDW